MLYSYLKITRNVENDFILGMNKKGDYTQNKHISDRKIGILGFTFYGIGFVLQVIGLLVAI